MRRLHLMIANHYMASPRGSLSEAAWGLAARVFGTNRRIRRELDRN